MNESKELTQYSDEPGTLNVAQIQQQVSLIQTVLNEVMQKDQHYGVIPGCGKKPSLLKPGAEKICMTFRLAPSYEIEDIENVQDTDHREDQVICTLTHIPTGQVFGQGLGSCSTMESKYRYRNTYVNGDKIRTENDCLADQYNTVLKMAKKRAMVDAVLTATAASDIFTQDVEDMNISNGKEAGSESSGGKSSSGKKITDKQIGFLLKVAKGKDMGEAELAEYVSTNWGIDKVGDILMDDFNDILAHVKEMKAGETQDIPF